MRGHILLSSNAPREGSDPPTVDHGPITKAARRGGREMKKDGVEAHRVVLSLSHPRRNRQNFLALGELQEKPTQKRKQAERKKPHLVFMT